MTQPLKIGVLLSGSGTNLQALIDDIRRRRAECGNRSGGFFAPRCVRNRTRAQAAGIPVLVMNKTLYADAEAADAQIVEALQAAGAEYIVMAGYMRKVTPVMLRAFPNRVLNLHPALLPSFKGAHAIRDAFEAGVKVTV